MMYGKEFLVFYIMVIAMTLAGCYWAMQTADDTAQAGPPPLPQHPNPFEIAYLRGGLSELARVVLLSLINRNYLMESEVPGERSKLLVRPDNPPSLDALTAPERAVYDAFADPEPERIRIVVNKAAAALAVTARTYDEHLVSAGMLLSDAAIKKMKMAKLTGTLVIAGIGGYKLLAAIAHGRSNFGFLILLGLFGLWGVNAICKIDRVSKRGRLLLEKMQDAFENLKATAESNTPDSDYQLMMLAGVFGAAALVGTTFVTYDYLFAPPYPARQLATGGCSSCGTGCSSCGSTFVSTNCTSGSTCSSGSSCSGGSSCGGGSGCGGCGGGGD